MIIRQVPTVNPNIQIFQITIDASDNAESYAVNYVDWYWANDLGETRVIITNQSSQTVYVDNELMCPNDLLVVPFDDFPVTFSLYTPVEP